MALLGSPQDRFPQMMSPPSRTVGTAAHNLDAAPEEKEHVDGCWSQAASAISAASSEHFSLPGRRVQAVDNLMYGVGQQGLFHLCANPAFEFVKGDVRREAAVRRRLHTDVMVHLAAMIVGTSACDRDPLLATSVNLEAVRLLSTLRSPPATRRSPNTNSGYRPPAGQSFCTEESPAPAYALWPHKVREAESLYATAEAPTSGLALRHCIQHAPAAASTCSSIILFTRLSRKAIWFSLKRISRETISMFVM